MAMSVTDRGRSIATFRFVAVQLMETVAAWTPTTPEMEVKVVLGRHIWDFAQQADALGKRTFELRLPLQHSMQPSGEYLQLLDELRARQDTAERLSSLYDAVLPGLSRRYQKYLADTDPLLDEPGVRILERIRGDYRRQIEEAAAVRAGLGLPTADARVWSTREQASTLLAAAS